MSGAVFSILGRGRAGRALAQAFGGRAELLPGCTQPQDLPLDRWVVLALPDDALDSARERFPGRCVHLSGSLHFEGVPCLHPLTSFDGQARDYRGTPLAQTGEAPEAVLNAFVGAGFLPFPLRAEQKALYHACAVLTSGHVASLWMGAQRLLAGAGVALPGRGLLPLAEATLRNLEAHGEAGRTGPFVRGDEGTIQRDCQALPEVWRGIFLGLGRMG